MYRNRSTSLLLLSLMFPMYVHAGFAGFAISPNPLRAELSGGYTFFANDNSTNNQHIFATPIETDTLHQKNTRDRFVVHIGADKDFTWTQLPAATFSLGPHFYYQQGKFTGDVYQFGLPTLNNYTYRFQAEIYSFLLEARASWCDCRFWWVQPYVLFGIGPSITKFKYEDKPNPGIPDGAIGFSPHFNWHFAFDAGIGANFPITQYVSVGAKYVYIHNGDQRINSHLYSASDISANTNNIMFSLNLAYA